MATLTGNTIASTYTGLLSVTGAIGATTLESVTDGAGTATSLSLSRQKAKIVLGTDSGDDFTINDGSNDILLIEGDTKDVTVLDDFILISDSSVIKMGAGADATFTHDGTTGLTIAATPISINSTGDLTLDSSTDIVLDAAGGNFEFKDAGTTQLTIDVDTTAGDIDINLGVNGDDLVFNQYDGTEVMRITDTARVGIGEVAPDAFLSINQGADDGEILTFKSSDIAHGMTDFTETDTYARFQKGSATLGGLSITGMTETGGVASMTLGGYSTDEDNTRSTSGAAPVVLNGRTKTSATVGDMGADKNIVVIRNNATTRFIFDSDGDLHSDSSNTTFSDSRLKSSIEDIPYGLADILKLKPKRFDKESGNFDDSGNIVLEGNKRKMIGFMAQDVKAVIPEMVKDIDESKSFYSMEYGKLVSVLTKAVQELSASNDALKARIEVLEAA